MSSSPASFSHAPPLWRLFLQAQADFLHLICAETAACFRNKFSRPVLRFLWCLLVFPLIFLWQAGNWFFLFLDEWLFPAARRQPLNRPVFVLGPPRSGTTFLHRLLAESSPAFSSAPAWELLLAPSVCQKKILAVLRGADRICGSPLRKSVLWLEARCTSGLKNTHPGSLLDPEEDYFYLSSLAACTGWIIPFPAWRGFQRLIPGRPAMSDARRRAALHFYRRCLQKQLYAAGGGKILLSKNASFSSWTDLLPDFFPDARWIILLRTPLETVPSMLSTADQAMQGCFAGEKDPEFPEQLLAAMQAHYQTLRQSVPGLSPCVTVNHAELRQRLPELLRLLEERLELPFDPEFKARLTEWGEKSARHQSSHHYALADWDLDAESLRQTCPLMPSTLSTL